MLLTCAQYFLDIQAQNSYTFSHQKQVLIKIFMTDSKYNKEVFDLVNVAHKLRKEGQFTEAEAKYLEVLKLDTDNLHALAGLGNLKCKTKRFKESLHYYQRCLELEDTNRYALAGAGDAYRGLKDMDSALEVWLKYLSCYSGDYKIITRVGDALRKKCDLPGSKKYYLLAIELRPKDPFALMGLGDVCEKMGNDAEALFYSMDYSIFAITSAANIYRKTKAYEKALELYDTALAKDPKNSHVWNGKADCLRGMRAYEDAINAWENALKYGMNRRIAMTRIGDSYMNINDLENAEISYQNIVAIDYDKYAYLGMYRIHLKRNHIDKAFETLTMLMKKEPHDPRISSEYNIFVEKYPHVKNIENKKAVPTRYSS